MEKEPITIQGFEKLKEELGELKKIKRPKIIEAIAEARGHGDLKENAEYHAAKEEQAKIESRVLEINDLIARANVIDITKLEKKNNVIFGSTVNLINLENNEKKKKDCVSLFRRPRHFHNSKMASRKLRCRSYSLHS